jgi:hypothetical protein
MKKTLMLLAALICCGTTRGQLPPGQTLADVLRDTDVVAVVSVTNVEKSIVTNAGKREVTTVVANAAVERVLKGNPLKSIRIQEEVGEPPFSSGTPVTAVLASKTRMLVCLKRTGDTYTASHRFGLAPVYGSGSDARTTWPACIPLDEAVANIQKTLKQK